MHSVKNDGYWEVAFILFTSLNVLCDEFLPVLSSCRYWGKSNIYSDVAIGDVVLHCIFDQDKIPGIVYTEWTTVPSGYCPVYNRHAKLIDGIPCNTSVGDCPTTLVKSFQAVAYTGCFQMPHINRNRLINMVGCPPVPATDKKDMKPQINTEKCPSVKEIDKKIIVTVDVILTVLILATAVQWVLTGKRIYQWYKRTRRQQASDDVEDRTQTDLNKPANPSSERASSSSLTNGVYNLIDNHDTKW